MVTLTHPTLAAAFFYLRRYHIAWIAIVLLALPIKGIASPRPIHIAITPCTDVAKTFALHQPLAHYLEQRLKRPISLVIPKDFNEFERFIRSGDAEFAFQAPHTYVRLASLYNRKMLLKALTPEGKTSHRGVIVVRKDSPIKRIEDIKGKRLLFGAENDLAKSLAAWLLLEKHGIRPATDLTDYKHGGSCESIALNVYLKTADAGVLCDYSFEDIDAAKEPGESNIPPHQLRILAHTDEVPTWVFAALNGVEQNLVAQLNQALTTLHRTNKVQRNILERLEVGGFIPAKDSDFDHVRKMLPARGRTP